jgi:hypothetical protein
MIALSLFVEKENNKRDDSPSRLCNIKLENLPRLLPAAPQQPPTTTNNWLASFFFWTRSTWLRIRLKEYSYSLESRPRAKSQKSTQASLWTNSATENQQKQQQQRQQHTDNRAAAKRHTASHTSHLARETPCSPAIWHVFALGRKANQLFQCITVLH